MRHKGCLDVCLCVRHSKCVCVVCKVACMCINYILFVNTISSRVLTEIRFYRFRFWGFLNTIFLQIKFRRTFFAPAPGSTPCIGCSKRRIVKRSGKIHIIYYTLQRKWCVLCVSVSGGSGWFFFQCGCCGCCWPHTHTTHKWSTHTDSKPTNKHETTTEKHAQSRKHLTRWFASRICCLRALWMCVCVCVRKCFRISLIYINYIEYL